MGDRTSLQVYVYACPEDQRAAALATIGQYAHLEYETGQDETQLSLTEPYIEHEASCAVSAEVAANLIQAAPGCSFVLWEDPTRVYLGDVVAYTPRLGMFSASCDAEGSPVYAPSQIMAMVDGLPPGTDLVAHVAQATGGPWFEDWEEHQPDDTAAG